MEMHDVVRKLIGPVEPVGCSATDSKRYDNLSEQMDLVSELIAEIYRISIQCSDSYQSSVQIAGKRSTDFLKEMGDYCG